MSFMQPAITMELTWWEVTTRCGESFILPHDLPLDIDWNRVETIERREGHGARLSAPGYMDCTEWSVHRTEAEAAQYLIDTYYDMPDDEMTADQLDEYNKLVRITKGLE